MFVIGIIGKKGSGKTAMTQTMASEVAAGHNVYHLAFGDALKEMLITAGMVTYRDVYVRKTKLSRWLLQKVGTEIFRRQIDPQYWVKKVDERLKSIEQSDPDAVVIISDVRFPEEAKIVLEHQGFLVRIWRPLSRWRYWLQCLREFSGANDHASETAQDSIKAELTVKNSGTLFDLKHSGREVFSILYERYEFNKAMTKAAARLEKNVPNPGSLDSKGKMPWQSCAQAAERR